MVSQADLVTMLQTLKDSPAHSTQFDESWSQGRLAFGGISAAFAVTKMCKEMEPTQPACALLVSFLAPIPPGEISVVTRIQRRGKNVTQLSADLLAKGLIALQAMGVFRNSCAALNLDSERRSNLPPRTQGIPFSAHSRRLPHFLGNCDGYWIDGGMPFSGSKKTNLAMWVRHNASMDQFPIEKIITICDIPPPVILSYFDKPLVPASSLTWSLDFVVPRKPLPVSGSFWIFKLMRQRMAIPSNQARSSMRLAECAPSRANAWCISAKLPKMRRPAGDSLCNIC